MADLCFQVLGLTADYSKVAGKGVWTKVLYPNHVQPIQDLGGKVFYRPRLDGDDGAVPDGVAWANRAWDSLAGSRPEAIGFRNEMQGWDPETAVRVFFDYKTQLRRRGYSGIVVFGSYAVGWPDYPQWPTIVAAVKKYGDGEPFYVEFHEYWDLYPDSSDKSRAWRHVLLLDQGLIPPDWRIFIGECGADRLKTQDPQQRGGWDDKNKLTSDQEAQNLLTYRLGCAGQVEAIFVFGDYSQDPQWQPYRTIGTSQEQAIRSTWTMTNVPEDSQGPTRLCGYAAVEECVEAAGGKADMVNLYERVKGKPFVAPGDGSSFGEIVQAVKLAAADNGFDITWHQGSQAGILNDFPSFEAAIKAGEFVIAGIDESVINGSQNYGHFIVCTQIVYAADGTPLIRDVDSYRDFDSNPTYIPVWQLEQAIRQNWDPNGVCIAFRLSKRPNQPSFNGLQGNELAAYKYYTQNGVDIDVSHALWKSLLYPAWTRYNQMVQAGDKLADAFRFGPLTKPETGTTWGPKKLPAAVVRLTNRVVGVHLDSDGSWDHPYQVEL